MKSFFGLFFDFFTGKNLFSRPLFGQILTFFTPTFIFHGHFLVFFWIFSRVTNKFSRAEIVFLHGEFYSFNGHILIFFSRASFCFSRAHFQENFHGQFSIFTGTSRGFFRFFHGLLFFSRAQMSIFFTGKNCFFTGKKKNTGQKGK